MLGSKDLAYPTPTSYSSSCLSGGLETKEKWHLGVKMLYNKITQHSSISPFRIDLRELQGQRVPNQQMGSEGML